MAMAGSETRRLVNLGGKSSSLSSTSVFQVANSLALVRIDSSAVSRLSSNSSNNNTHVSANFQFSIPNFLTLEEARASVLLFINNLIRSSTSSNVDASKIVDILNRGSGGFNYDGITLDGVSDGELSRLDYSLAAMNGMCALIDYRSSVLSTIADGMAALSCEALKADVSSAFNFVDSGDGSSSKDDVGVAGDLKVLLNGSKLVGANAKLLANEASVSDIPQIHGILREVSRLVHSRTRVLLNSPVVISKGAGKGGSASVASATGQVLATTLSPLALALRNLGKGSRRRAELNLELMGKDGDLHSLLQDTFQKNCPGQQTLKDHYISSQAALEEVDYITLLHEICSLLEAVRKIVSWEAITAFASLEGGELIELLKGNTPLKAEVREENAKGSKKNEKRKKVLGKGTTVLIQFIKDNLLSRTKEPVDFSVSVNRWVQDFLSFLDPKDLQFEDLLNKVKDIVESNETRRLPKLPKGTRDFAREQMAIRERAFSIIVEVFKRHGAMALDTPAFELRETLMGKYGEDSKLIYDLADQGGELCSLRYDLTVPFARYVAMNGLTSFKRYQIAKVYRRDNPSKGRYREFYQCDFDIAGQHEHMGPDFEVLRILTELLDELKIGGYEVKLNHRKLLDGMMEICGVPPEKFRTICSSIDKLDKQPLEQIKKEMVEEKGLTVETAEKIGTYVKERGQPLELLSKLKQEGSEFLKNSACLVALNELEILFKALEKSRCTGKVVFDLSLARGLDYYTGVIFEAIFKGATQVGSIAAGGRYDNLIGMFGTRHVPAVGVSLGIERVFTIMEQLQKDQNQAIRPNETQVLVSVLGDDLSLGAELVSELWDAKLKAEYMVNKRVMKHIDRAKDSGIPWMVIVGERELNEGIVKLKDVAVSKDEPVERTRLVEELQRRLNGTSS